MTNRGDDGHTRPVNVHISVEDSRCLPLSPPGPLPPTRRAAVASLVLAVLGWPAAGAAAGGRDRGGRRGRHRRPGPALRPDPGLRDDRHRHVRQRQRRHADRRRHLDRGERPGAGRRRRPREAAQQPDGRALVDHRVDRRLHRAEPGRRLLHLGPRQHRRRSRPGTRLPDGSGQRLPRRHHHRQLVRREGHRPHLAAATWPAACGRPSPTPRPAPPARSTRTASRSARTPPSPCCPAPSATAPRPTTCSASPTTPPTTPSRARSRTSGSTTGR